MSVLGLLCVTAACTLPFYFAGIAITLVLTKSSLPVGFIYASDLFGAAMGCLLVLGGLEFLDAPSLILLCGAIGAIAGVVYLWNTAPQRDCERMNVAAAIVLAAMTDRECSILPIHSTAGREREGSTRDRLRHGKMELLFQNRESIRRSPRDRIYGDPAP